MPPAKSRTAPDDSRSEASSTREKLANVAGLVVNGKGRRVASGLGMNSSLRDSVNVSVVSTSTTVGVVAQDATVGVDYMMLDTGKGRADNKIDAMVNARFLYTTCIPTRLSTQHTLCLQQSLQSDHSVASRYRPAVTYNGAAQRSTKAEQGTISKRCTQTFQWLRDSGE
jgi:hypothetical protein